MIRSRDSLFYPDPRFRPETHPSAGLSAERAGIPGMLRVQLGERRAAADNFTGDVFRRAAACRRQLQRSRELLALGVAVKYRL